MTLQTESQALETAIAMLQAIASGESFTCKTYHDKLDSMIRSQAHAKLCRVAMHLQNRKDFIGPMTAHSETFDAMFLALADALVIVHSVMDENALGY